MPMMHSGLLGSGTYEVQVIDRITKAVVPITEVLRINWSRRRDGPGNASVQFATGNCAGLNLIRSWRHELFLTREPGGLMFVGPILGIEDGKGLFTITASDRSIWLDYRYPRGNEKVTDDWAALFRLVVSKALRDYDPIDLKLRVMDTGKTGTISWDYAERKTASQIIKDMLDSTIDFTIIGDTLFAGERTIETGIRATLTEADISSDITGAEVGKDLTTIIHARGKNGLVVSYPPQTNEAIPTGDAYYGIIEQSTDFGDIDNVDDLTVAARSWWLTRRFPPYHPRIPAGSQLSAMAPIMVEWLIPGAQVYLTMDEIHCRQSSGLYEIDTVDCSAGAGGGGTPHSASGQFVSVAEAANEQIQVSMVAAIR